MTRVKKGVNALKYRRNLLKQTKGYRHGRSKKERLAQEALFHAGAYAFAHRRDKKGDFRRLWQVRMSAVLKEEGTSYSRFMGNLKKKGVALDRKTLAELALAEPAVFKKLIAETK